MQEVPESYSEAQIQQPFLEEASQPMELVLEADERSLQSEMKRSSTTELLLELESSREHKMPVAMMEAREVLVASTSVVELIATLHSSFRRSGPLHLTHVSVQRLRVYLRSPSFSHQSDLQGSRTTDEVAHRMPNLMLFPVAEQLERLRRLERLCIDQTTRRQGDQRCFHEYYHSTNGADQGILCPNFVDAGLEGDLADEVLTQLAIPCYPLKHLDQAFGHQPLVVVVVPIGVPRK